MALTSLGRTASRLTVLVTISCLGIGHGGLISGQQVAANRCHPGRKGLCRGESRGLLEGELLSPVAELLMRFMVYTIYSNLYRV
jgi:hypothetical protein